MTKQDLYDSYNATSTDDGNGDIETYENWLERQLISRIETIEELTKEVKEEKCSCKKPTPNYPEMLWCDECSLKIQKK